MLKTRILVKSPMTGVKEWTEMWHIRIVNRVRVLMEKRYDSM